MKKNKILLYIAISITILVLFLSIKKWLLPISESAGASFCLNNEAKSFYAYDKTGEAFNVDFSNNESITLLLVFSLSCETCTDNIPFFKEIYSFYENKNVIVVNAVLNDPSLIERNIEFKELNINYIAPKTPKKFMELYNITAIPELFIIDKKGEIVDNISPFTENDKYYLLKIVKELIKQG